MAAMIDTAKVTGRRQLHFKTPDDIQADVERLAVAKELRALGNWSAGQNLQHLATVMNKSIDGFTERPPLPVRLLLSLIYKRKFLTTPMSAGFKLPAGAQKELVSGPLSTQDGIDSMRKALQRLRTEEQRVPHPVFGAYTRDEWDQLHCRHCELHLSFIVPVGA